MLGFIIIMLVFICVGFYVGYEDFGGDFIGSVIYSMLFFLLGGAFCLVLAMGIDGFAKEEEYVYKEQNLVALQDGNTVEGSFFLGSGTIDSEFQYTYMTKEKFGYNVKQVYAENTFIKESDKDEPKIVTYHYKYKNNFLEKYFNVFGDMRYHHSEITIPKNSIIQNYNVDLE